MKGKRLNGAAVALALVLVATASYAQTDDKDVYWRLDSHVKTCSMVIDPSLTQAQWHTFVKQGGAIMSFKSLASAKTLGKMNFNIAIDDGYSPVDQHDLAWINTFTHPDETCPLGDAITFPTIRARMGVSDNMDIGAFWTTAPGANYGVTGGEIKYAFLRESKRTPAAAVRTSVSLLTGVPDFNVNIYSVDLMTSKSVAMLTPYVGFRQSVIIGTETTSKVDLDTERPSITQGYAGVTCSIWKLSLAAEYDISTVNTFALAIGANL